MSGIHGIATCRLRPAARGRLALGLAVNLTALVLLAHAAAASLA